MLKNYLKVGIRNILRYKVFSLINVFGLAVAMSVCLLIILMLSDQMQYDEFHTHKDRIFRVISQNENANLYATTPDELSPTLVSDYPFIERTTRLTMGVGGDATYKKQTQTMRGFFTDPAFFEVFSFELGKGNPETALQAPNAIVITSEFARRLFGDEDPLNKTIRFDDRGLPHLDISGIDSPPVDWGNFTVTGILEDKKLKSHLQFDVLMSMSTLPALIRQEKIDDHRGNWAYYYQTYTYVLLDRDKNVDGLTTALNDAVEAKYKDLEDLQGFQLLPQPLGEITPGKIMGNITNFSMPIEGYYLLIFLAVVVMASACLNYTNLSIARVLTRAREIGVRKVTGAGRKDIFLQFLSESIITSLLALVIAIGLLFFVKPAFMGLWVNKYLNFDLQENISVYLVFLVFALIIGVIAGVFPALHMSKYMPITVLKNINTIKPGKLGLRKFLTGTQFVISLFFIVTSILIYKQLRHFLEFEYGFTSESIVNVELQSNDYELIANEFSTVPGVSTISASEYIPATGISTGINLKQVQAEEYESFTKLSADENFIGNLDLEIISGRNLPPAGESLSKYIVVNEAMAKHYGFEDPQDIVGLNLNVEGESSAVEVIGVVNDFRFRLLMFEDDIRPLVLRNNPEKFSYLNLKVASGDLMRTISDLEKKWKSIDTVHPFKYKFFDQQLANTHQVFVDLVSVIGTIAFLAVTIACFGLLGMAIYSSERRMKEVSIRKVFGAETFSIIILLSKSFLKMLGVSVIIAAPLSYFANNLWLENFANRVEFGLGTVLLGTVILLILGMITIGSQTVKASRNNPVDSLRSE